MLHFCLGRWITRIMLTSLILISSFLIPQQARAAVTPFGSLRFPQPTATINVSGPAATLTAWNTAIKAWNKTGVFTFTKVTGKAQLKLIHGRISQPIRTLPGSRNSHRTTA